MEFREVLAGFPSDAFQRLIRQRADVPPVDRFTGQRVHEEKRCTEVAVNIDRTENVGNRETCALANDGEQSRLGVDAVTVTIRRRLQDALAGTAVGFDCEVIN